MMNRRCTSAKKRWRESISINTVECIWMIYENCEQIFVKSKCGGKSVHSHSLVLDENQEFWFWGSEWCLWQTETVELPAVKLLKFEIIEKCSSRGRLNNRMMSKMNKMCTLKRLPNPRVSQVGIRIPRWLVYLHFHSQIALNFFLSLCSCMTIGHRIVFAVLLLMTRK